MTALECRYRRLLWAYPARYRRERAEELLGTLLENTPPGRRWPILREACALLTGGLRVRSGLNQRLTMAANLRLAALLGLTLMLLQLAAFDLRDIITFWKGWHSVPPGTGHAAAYLALTAAVLAAAFFAPRWLAAALASVTAALWFWWDGDHGEGFLAAMLLVILATLVRGHQRLPRIWLWVPGSMLALHMLQALAVWQSAYLLMSPALTMDLWWLILGGVVLWIVIDPRPAIAVAIYIMFLVAESVGPFGFQPQISWRTAAYAASAAIVAAVAMWRMHRQAVV